MKQGVVPFVRKDDPSSFNNNLKSQPTLFAILDRMDIILPSFVQTLKFALSLILKEMCKYLGGKTPTGSLHSKRNIVAKMLDLYTLFTIDFVTIVV